MRRLYTPIGLSVLLSVLLFLAACGGAAEVDPPLTPSLSPTSALLPTVLAREAGDVVSATASIAAPTTVDAAPSTPDLGSASLTIAAASAMPGEPVTLEGADFPANATVEIGLGPPASEYEIIDTVQADANGRFSAPISLPDYVEPGSEWIFVADVNNAKVTADPIQITGEAAPLTPESGVNEPVDGQFSRSQIFLIALEDNGQSSDMIGCNDSVVPVVVEFEPTVAPLTAVLEQLLALDEEFYGQSGLYNVFHQSNLAVASVDIEAGEAIVQLTGMLNLGGVCDNPRVKAQLEQTALQFDTIDSATFYLNDEPLSAVLSEQ